MTTGITAPNAPQHIQSGLPGEIKSRADAPIKVEEMSTAQVANLSHAVAERLIAEGRTAGGERVDLRAPTIPLGEAATLLRGIISKLPAMLAGLVPIDPIKTEPGTELRLTEAAAVNAVRTDAAGQPDATFAEPATGGDVEAADRLANLGAWIKGNPFANLLTFLRQLLLEFEAMDRRNNSQMIILNREMTIRAGELGVEKAKQNVVATALAAGVTAAVGGAAVHQSFKSTKIQTDSNVKHLNNANRTAVDSSRTSHAARSNPLPSADHRGARNLDGSAVKQSGGDARPAADLQDDMTSYTSAMKQTSRQVASERDPDILQSAHAYRMAQSQIPASNAMFLNTISSSAGGVANAGMQIEVEQTEAERLLIQSVAETFKRVADAHQDQQVKNREMREATGQLLETLMNLAASTSSHVISKS
ncbi:hypothetical protein [Stenotrophomonas sp.]|uniref:hypothetical protein n=1 Tax=Stenotrophomonas sp. TaxID=69392 RepID=UPI0028A697CA|nr:hypothetical protein [Stenotrophomonas sp.]